MKVTARTELSFNVKFGFIFYVVLRRDIGIYQERRPLLSPYGVGEEARNVQLEDRLAACESALEETVVCGCGTRVGVRCSGGECEGGGGHKERTGEGVWRLSRMGVAESAGFCDGCPTRGVNNYDW